MQFLKLKLKKTEKQSKTLMFLIIASIVLTILFIFTIVFIVKFGLFNNSTKNSTPSSNPFYNSNESGASHTHLYISILVIMFLGLLSLDLTVFIFQIICCVRMKEFNETTSMILLIVGFFIPICNLVGAILGINHCKREFEKIDEIN